MTRRPDQFPDDPDDALPPALLADLFRANPTPAVPPTVDAAVRNRARAYFGRQQRVRRWVRIGGAAAVAASVLVVVGLRLAMPPGREGRHAMEPRADAPQAAASPAAPPRTAAAGPADVDRNGVVDVLDAFAVARGVRDGRTQPAWDLTGDGVVDGRDADRIAEQAVRVKGGRQ